MTTPRTFRKKPVEIQAALIDYDKKDHGSFGWRHHEGRPVNGILCEGVTDPPGSPHRRCIRIDTRPGCDPRCGDYDQDLGYVDAAEWAEEMLKTHDQIQCPGCGLWTIWQPKTEETRRA